MIMQAVGVAEDNIFRKRKEDDVSFHCASSHTSPASLPPSSRVWLMNRLFLPGKLQEKDERETKADEGERMDITF